MGVLSLKQKIALELNRQLVKELEDTHPLRQLFWECTLRCNMHCRHCGSDCKISAVSPDMPFEDFRKVLEDVKARYDSHRIMVILTGGEPLMRSDIVDVTRKIYEMEFPVGMVSNGRLMTPEKIKALLGAGLHSATISLDGLEEDHNWMRGTDDGFKYASRAISILANEPSIRFDVVTCVNKRNIHKLALLKEYLISLGLKDWRLFTVFPVGRAANDPELQLSPEEFRELLEFIKATRREGRINASYACEGFVGGYEGEVRDYLYACQAGLSVGSVLADGSISACASIRSDYHQGNIYKDSFSEVWERGFKEYRNRDWMKKDQCGDCKWFRYCLGNGMHLRGDDGKLILCHMSKLYQ